MNKIPQVGQLLHIENLYLDNYYLCDYADKNYTKLNGLFKVEKVQFDSAEYDGICTYGTFWVDLYLSSKELLVIKDVYGNLKIHTHFLKLTLDSDKLDMWKKNVNILPPGETAEILYG